MAARECWASGSTVTCEPRASGTPPPRRRCRQGVPLASEWTPGAETPLYDRRATERCYMRIPTLWMAAVTVKSEHYRCRTAVARQSHACEVAHQTRRGRRRALYAAAAAATEFAQRGRPAPVGRSPPPVGCAGDPGMEVDLAGGGIRCCGAEAAGHFGRPALCRDEGVLRAGGTQAGPGRGGRGDG